MDYWSTCAFVLVDTPDPYVKLFIPTAPNGKKKTQTINNSNNPVWNNEFKFLIDRELENVLCEYSDQELCKRENFTFFAVFVIIDAVLVFYSSDITLMEDDTLSDDLIGETETFPLSGLEIDRILRKTFIFRQVFKLLTFF